MPGSMNTMRCGLISEAALLSGSEKIVPRALYWWSTTLIARGPSNLSWRVGNVSLNLLGNFAIPHSNWADRHKNLFGFSQWLTNHPQMLLLYY
jgi:hypothetical protein